MNKRFLSLMAVAIPVALMAQTAFDAYQLSRYDLKGTARYMSMAGAFGALGGDLSTLNQNPGGIGVYRKSEVGFTLDIDLNSSTFNSSLGSDKQNFTKAHVPNIGYVGSTLTGSSIMPVFNWGFSYGRTASFNRRYSGSIDLNTSLSNYIANYTTAEAWTPGELSSSDYNYWNNGHAPWSSLLAYNTYLINPTSAGATTYKGLWDNSKTFGVADVFVDETGYIDEYEMNLGGNINNVVYWGIGVGITDLEYSRTTYYDEYLDYAQLPVITNGEPVAGPATSVGSDTGFDWTSYKRITGTGFNFKAGVILRPVNELRLGFAIHTPTYYNLNEANFGSARTYYGYEYDQRSDTYTLSNDVYTESPVDEFSWKLRTPWRMMVSAAGVIGSKGIISVDYEYRPYQNMTAKFNDGVECEYVNGDIKDYYKSANILRLGAELRLSNNFSVRAGYSVETSATGKEIKNDDIMMYNSNPYDTNTDPTYTLDNSTQYITCGIGYRYKGFYADAAYVHKSLKSDFHSCTSYQDNMSGQWVTPSGAELKTTNNNIVLSIGYRF